MDRKRIAKMSAGYTFFEVLISTALLLLLTKIEYLFDTSKRLRGLEFYYTAAAHTDEHRIKCLFSFVPVIPFQKGE